MSIYKDKRWWNIFCMILWCIWMNRNSKLFGKVSRDPNIAVEQAIKVLGESEFVNKISPSLGNRSESKKIWSPPTEYTYKINSNVTIFGEGLCSLGAVMRDSFGDVLVATCYSIEGNWEVDVAEALATRQGLVIALESGLRDVILESNNMKLYNHLKKSLREASYFGSILSDIRMVAVKSRSCSVSHVKRKGNLVAHIEI